MIEIMIFIPLKDNDKKSFSSSYHAQFEQEVLKLVGGLTRYSGTNQGMWADNGKVYTDDIRVYGIAINSIADGGKIGQIAELAKSHYRQEAVYIKYLGLAEII